MGGFELQKPFLHNGATIPGHISSPEIIRRAKEFIPGENDVIIAGYPRSGNNWLHYATYLIQNCDGDVSDPKNYPRSRYFLEVSARGDVARSDVERAKRAAHRPKALLTHLYFRDLHRQIVLHGCKTILVVRDPKDMLVSMYHLYLANMGKGTWNEFFNLYKSKQLMFGDWSDQVSGYLTNVHLPNVLLIRYEDMKRDIRKILAKVSRFLGKDVNGKKMDEIVDSLSIKNMKSESALSGSYLQKLGVLKSGSLLRKGETGEWRQYFNQEQTDCVHTRCGELMKELGYHIQAKL